jgi:hypothetical protein
MLRNVMAGHEEHEAYPSSFPVLSPSLDSAQSDPTVAAARRQRVGPASHRALRRAGVVGLTYRFGALAPQLDDAQCWTGKGEIDGRRA